MSVYYPQNMNSRRPWIALFLFCFLLSLPVMAQTYNLDNLPFVIPDPSAPNWVVDRFAGNTTTGTRFYQGPRTEIGGLTGGTNGTVLVLDDGTTYIADGNSGLSEVSPDGTLWRLMGTKGLNEGLMEQCEYGTPFWNRKDSSLYLTGSNCLRRVVKHPDGSDWVEVVAGIYNTAGSRDGPAKSATLKDFTSIACDSQGTFYWGEGYTIRRIRNDSVTTLPFNGTGSFTIGPGRNDNLLYIYYYSDIWSLDLTTFDTTHLFGALKGSAYESRIGDNADGPALTHASNNSHINIGAFDHFHDALWVGGPDESMCRWLKMGAGSDGWVRSVTGLDGYNNQYTWNQNAMNVPAAQVYLMWNRVAAYDNKGGIYILSAGSATGIWRAYNKTEVK